MENKNIGLLNNITENEDAPEKAILNTKGVAQLLGIGMNSTYKLMNHEGFPKITIGKKYVVIRSSLLDWLQKNQGRVIEI